MISNNNNVLLVTIDSLRADHVFEDYAATPAHDRLINECTFYRRAFSQGPFTTFSMPSLFTSRYPSGLQYMEFSESTVGTYIDDEPTLSSTLQSAGYETAGFHSNPLLSNLFGFDRGFDTFDARLPFSDTEVLPGRMKILADKLFRLVRKHPYLPAERVNQRAIDWLDQGRTEKPFFLWLHYMDVHGPYIAKDGSHYLNKYKGERLWRKAVRQPDDLTENERNQLRDLYREEVEYTDAQLGHLFDQLQDRSLWENTIVTVTSDHGEGFGEHGTFSHPHQLYDELTHVPLIIRDPDIDSGEVDGIVELLDLAPTIVHKVTGDYPSSFVGMPLQNSDGATNTENTAISEGDIVPFYNGSIRTNRYRYIRNDIADREELYDLQADPNQQRNIADKCPNIRAELDDKLESHLADPRRKSGTDRKVSAAEIDDLAVQDRLRDLGYME